MTLGYPLLHPADLKILFVYIILFSAIAAIVHMVLTFVPVLMKSIVARVKNPSILYSEDTLHNSKVHESRFDGNIDQFDIGSSKLLDSAFRKLVKRT